MNFLKLFIFRKKTESHEFPVLDACEFLKIDVDDLKRVIDKYGQFLEQGTASVAFEIHKGNKFSDVRTKAEALNVGQNCFADFCKKFYGEYHLRRRVGATNIDQQEKELEVSAEIM